MVNVSTIGELELKIGADSKLASDGLDRLVLKLDKLSTTLGFLEAGKLNTLATGVRNLGTAMQTLNTVRLSDYTRLAKGLERIGNVSTANLTSLATSLGQIGNYLGNLGNASAGAQQIIELANGIKQLGYKSAEKAVANIPLLATAMKDLMATLSTAPKVSQNIIDMTNALAKLARTGASSGKAANSLQTSLNRFSISTIGARLKTLNLASAIGLLYAKFWMVLRIARLFKKAIDLSSELTEVQNVVDTTFGAYTGKVEDLVANSISDYGMSELLVKKVSSRFQAMGTAMGFSQGKMADMSVELTKLTADMASFYNVEQEAVAEDLATIFTGQSRPLRTYGIDITEATLAEWAMKRGLDANISSMTQAEKAMLRYEYVMERTKVAQGDFLKTQDTWANQTRILVENIKALGTVLGTGLINALKPLVKALNVVMGHLINFAKVVSTALGAIFGWEYQVGGTGGVTSDLETAEGAAGGVADGIGGAADNAKKLKQQLAGIDELNVLTTDSASGGGSGGGGGSSVGVGAGDVDAGQWVQTEPLWEKYKSDLDTLYKLGEYIGLSIAKSLEGINWDKVYEKASGFGSGFAEFLNGLISPELFYEVGKTIANSLNTALITAISFGKTFDWTDFGTSLADGLNGLLINFDYSKITTGISVFLTGVKDAIIAFAANIDWSGILSAIIDGMFKIENIDLALDISKINITGIKGVVFDSDTSKTIRESVFKEISELISGATEGISIKIGIVVEDIKQKLSEKLDEAKKWWSGKRESLAEIKIKIFDLLKKIKSIWNDVKEWWNNKPKLSDIEFSWDDLPGSIKSIWDEVSRWWSKKPDLKQILFPKENLQGTTSSLWSKVQDWWNGKQDLKTVAFKTEDLPDKVSGLWSNTNSFWNNKGSLSKLTFTVDNLKTLVNNAWTNAKNFWNNKGSLSALTFGITDLVGVLQTSVNNLKTWWNKNKPELRLGVKLPTLQLVWDTWSDWGKAAKKFGLPGMPKFYVYWEYFEKGGFPTPGSYFVAGENGVPEMLGTVGGRTAVASGVEITGIRDAIIATGNDEIALLRQQNQLLQAILNKEFGITSDEIGKSARKYAKEYYKRTGNEAYSF